MKKNVDRVIVSNNLVVVIGWCEGPGPRIAVNGDEVEYQVCHRLKRPDVAEFLNSDDEREYGFRVSAVTTISGLDHSNISLIFPGGIIVEQMPTNPEFIGHEVFDRFVKTVADSAPGASMIELGSRARSGNTYKHLFPTLSTYTGVDMNPGNNVDVVQDIHTLSRAITSQYDFAFSVSVFEHLLMPWVAAVELNKVLVDGGLAYIQSHPTWPLHDEPWDFFRFSKHAWQGLFNSFTGFEILDAAYGMEASIMPASMAGCSLKDIEMQRSFLLSGCLIKKISEPQVDWQCDPSGFYSSSYSY